MVNQVDEQEIIEAVPSVVDTPPVEAPISEEKVKEIQRKACGHVFN